MSAPALGSPGARRARAPAALGVPGSTVGRLAIVYVALFAVLAVTAPNFLTADNLLNIARASSVFGIAALGLSVALVTGSLDVSFGAVMSLCGIVAAERLAAGQGVVTAVAIALCVGAGLGAVNGLVVTRLRVDALVVTLGTLSIFGGYAFLRSGGAPTPAPGDGFASLGRGELLGIPNPVWLLVLTAVVLGALLRFTVFGQRCYAVGDNLRASTLAGLPVARVRVAALTISGVTAALGGLLLAANAGVANPGQGEAYLLSAIAAVVIGGTSLTGGVGSIVGTVVGIALLGTIDNGLNLLGVSSFWQDVVRGAIVVTALILDRLRRGGL